jgi:hypothetical protein
MVGVRAEGEGSMLCRTIQFMTKRERRYRVKSFIRSQSIHTHTRTHAVIPRKMRFLDSVRSLFSSVDSESDSICETDENLSKQRQDALKKYSTQDCEEKIWKHIEIQQCSTSKYFEVVE